MSADAVSTGNESQQHDDQENKVTRLRSTKSTNLIQEIPKDEKDTKKKQPDRPFAVTQESYFTWSSGFEKFDGLIVWAALIITLGGTRLFLENVIKYGVQVSPTKFVQFLISQGMEEHWRTEIFVVLMNANFLFIYYLEKNYLAKGKMSSSQGTFIHIVHLIFVVVTPALLMRIFPNMFSLFGRFILVSLTWISVFKIWSYVQVNKWCRESYNAQKKNTMEKESDEDEPQAQNLIQYPNNLSLSDLYYFICSPTLCYELNYPRSEKIRIGFLLKRIFEFLVLINIMFAMIQQWVIPTVKGSFQAFEDMDYLWCIERNLKLAGPIHLIWLVFFYGYFHCYFNILGEILRFGDRKFYEDWWNARDLGTYWRLWNLPVHKWFVRHIYVPMLKSKYSHMSANLAVFTLSAIFHEYLISVPTRMYKMLVFAAFVLMVPLIYISIKVANKFGDRYGNVFMWLFLILGEPLAILVYYHDYVVKNFTVEEL